jgi:predicted dehydrogenase
LEFSAELQFGEGVTAGFYISFVTAHQQWAVISGNRGWIQLPDFVLPNYGSEVAFTINNADFAQNGCRFHMEDHPRRVAVREYSDGHPTAQETNLIRDFAALVLAGTPSTHWGEVSLKTQIVMDACLRSARAGGEEILIPQ